MFRALSGLMAALFAVAVVVQFNDPDPVRWILVYSIAGALTVLVAVGRRVDRRVAAAVGITALVWALRLAAVADRGIAPGELFQAWEMRDERVEIAREASGLLVVAGWMAILTVESWLHRDMTPPPRHRS